MMINLGIGIRMWLVLGLPSAHRQSPHLKAANSTQIMQPTSHSASEGPVIVAFNGTGLPASEGWELPKRCSA